MSDLKNQQFIVNDEESGMRLDIFLTKKFSDISRSQIKKYILRNQILVNEKKISVHHFLKKGDLVKIEKNTSLDTKNNIIKTSQLFNVEILHEDTDYFILEKPPGMLSHPVSENIRKECTLYDWILKKYPEMKEIQDTKNRAGIVHRLDREVSGIMVVARTQKGYNYLKDAFQKRKIHKEYWALVYGHMDREGSINLPIGRSKQGKFVAHPKIEGEKSQKQDRTAQTLYWTLRSFKTMSEMKIQIITGRSHQIRAHFSAVGHPIVGDPAYKPRKNFLNFFSKKIKRIEAPRIMLHAKKIGFNNLSGEWKEYESELPSEINKFLKNLNS